MFVALEFSTGRTDFDGSFFYFKADASPVNQFGQALSMASMNKPYT